MRQVDRRKFLGLVGAGTAAAATAASAAPMYSLLGAAASGSFTFRATGGLPAHPWPAYATALVEGSVDPEADRGVVAYRIVAGQPSQPSDIALPGLTRMVRVTKTVSSGGMLRIEGVVEDRSVLSPGESATMRFVVDRANRQLLTSMAGTEITLDLV